MTTDEAASPSITPQPGPNEDPAVTIILPSGTVHAGVRTTIGVNAFPGARWTLRGNNWVQVPEVTFSQTELDVGSNIAIRDHTGGGGSYAVTIPNPGTYQITAFCTETDGTIVSATPQSLTVVDAGPPVFNWVTPADGAEVDLGPAGAPVQVQLTSGADQFYPFTVSINHDGVITQDQDNSTSFSKTITLAPTPLGTRQISVTCTDPAGHSSMQIRTLNAKDGAPPTVGIDPFSSDVTVQSVPFTLTLTGTTPGAQSGVTGVAYAVTNGPSGAASNTGPGGDWSTWQAQIQLPTTGTFTFTITATDSRGSTASASGTINVHF